MITIKANVSRLNAEQLAAKSAYVEAEMANNQNFSQPTPTLQEVAAAREALQEAIVAAKSRARADIAVRNARTLTLRNLLSNLARYVNTASTGDEEKALSSGFELSRRPEPSTHLAPPSGLDVRVSDFEGCIDLRWKVVDDARMYQVYINDGEPSDPTRWSMVAVSSRTGTRITDLVPGKFDSFRVTALGRIGEGPASDVVSGRAA